MSAPQESVRVSPLNVPHSELKIGSPQLSTSESNGVPRGPMTPAQAACQSSPPMAVDHSSSQRDAVSSVLNLGGFSLASMDPRKALAQLASPSRTPRGSSDVFNKSTAAGSYGSSPVVLSQQPGSPYDSALSVIRDALAEAQLDQEAQENLADLLNKRKVMMKTDPSVGTLPALMSASMMAVPSIFKLVGGDLIPGLNLLQDATRQPQKEVLNSWASQVATTGQAGAHALDKAANVEAVVAAASMRTEEVMSGMEVGSSTQAQLDNLVVETAAIISRLRETHPNQVCKILGDMRRSNCLAAILADELLAVAQQQVRGSTGEVADDEESMLLMMPQLSVQQQQTLMRALPAPPQEKKSWSFFGSWFGQRAAAEAGSWFGFLGGKKALPAQSCGNYQAPNGQVWASALSEAGSPPRNFDYRDVEVVKEVPVIKEVEVIKEVIREVPVEVVKEVVREVEVIREVVVTETVEVIREVQVPVERIVEVEKIVTQIQEVQIPVTQIVPVETIVTQIKEVEVPVERLIPVETVRTQVHEVSREVPCIVRLEVAKEVEVTKQLPPISVPVSTETVLVREVHIPFEVQVPVEVAVNVPVEVEKVVTHEVPVEVAVVQVVEKEVPTVHYVDREVIVEKYVTVEKEVEVPVMQYVDREVIKEVPVEKRVEVPVIHYVDRETIVTVEKEVDKAKEELAVPAPTAVQAQTTRFIMVPKVTYVEEMVPCEEGEEGQYLSESQIQNLVHGSTTATSYTNQPHYTNTTSYLPTNLTTATHTNGATHTSNGTIHTTGATYTQQPTMEKQEHALVQPVILTVAPAHQQQTASNGVTHVATVNGAHAHATVAKGESTVTPRNLFSTPLLDPFSADEKQTSPGPKTSTSPGPESSQSGQSTTSKLSSAQTEIH